MSSKTDRVTVFNAIIRERSHQDRRWPRPQHNHTLTEYLVYIDHYVRQAMSKATTQVGDTATLEDILKIATLAVAAMEEHGVWSRSSS